MTCSSHSSSIDETISTLKFASRAKTLKNHFKMNIKSSPEALQRIIDHLRNELFGAKSEISRLRVLYLQATNEAEGNDKVPNGIIY